MFNWFFRNHGSAMFCKAFIIDLLGKRCMLQVWLKPNFAIGWHKKNDGVKGKLFWIENF